MPHTATILKIQHNESLVKSCFGAARDDVCKPLKGNKFSLPFLYTVKQTGDENYENYQLRDSRCLYITPNSQEYVAQRFARSSVRRISFQILGVYKSYTIYCILVASSCSILRWSAVGSFIGVVHLLIICINIQFGLCNKVENITYKKI